MDAVEEVEGYKPDSGFVEDSRAPLADLNLSDSTELWLVQWPLQELPELDGKEILLCLHGDACLGSFKDSSGKAYDWSAALPTSQMQQFSFPPAQKQILLGKFHGEFPLCVILILKNSRNKKLKRNRSSYIRCVLDLH